MSSTELQAVNEILASVGQSPVTTIDTKTTYFLTDTTQVVGNIAGTSLAVTAVKSGVIKVGDVISGGTILPNTSISAFATGTGGVGTYVVNISQNVNLTDIRVQSVTEQVEMQTNPDVAIAYQTLQQVSREVQSEGWTFNTEFNYTFTPDNSKQIVIPDNVLQLDLTKDYGDADAVRRNGKLYDRISHSFQWDNQVNCDVVWLFDWKDLPQPIKDYIVARAAAIVSSRLVGDGTQYQMLQQREAYCRAMALEYECNQGDYTYFGHPRGNNFYNSYQPYRALYR